MGEEELSERRAFVRAMLLRTFIDAKLIQEMAREMTRDGNEFLSGWNQSTTMHLVAQLQSAAHRLGLHLGAVQAEDKGFQ